MTRLSARGRLTTEGAIGIGVIALIGIAVWSFIGQDVRLCKQVFAGLVTGDQGVRQKIDWSHFVALDANVGSVYTQLPDGEKTPYEQTFVRNFSLGFAKAQADPSGFTNWRAQGDRTVTVDYPAKSKTAVFTLSENGKQVTRLAWK